MSRTDLKSNTGKAGLKKRRCQKIRTEGLGVEIRSEITWLGGIIAIKSWGADRYGQIKETGQVG